MTKFVEFFPTEDVDIFSYPTPGRQTTGSAGYDLSYLSHEYILGRYAAIVRTGYRVSLPSGHVGLLSVRSSLSFKRGLMLLNGVGIIDEDFKDEIKVLVTHPRGRLALEEAFYNIKTGDRIAQLVVVPYHMGGPVVNLSRSGGLGSTGEK